MRVLAVDDHEVEFWLRHTRTGVALTLAIVATVVLHGALSTGPHRSTAFAIVMAIAVGTPAVLALPLRAIVRHPLGALFFYAWEAFGIAVIALLGLLDGGGATPISLAYFMILVHGATAYPPVGVGVTGAMVTAAYLVVALAGPGTAPGLLACMLATITVVTATAAWASGNYRRVTQQKAALALQLAALADHDGLTGCLNHRAFHERLHAESARATRHGHALALLLVDLDDFKSVNDRYGHPAGDAVLVRISEALQQTARESDAVGRIGGDEFAMLLPETTAEEAAAVAQRLCATVRTIREPQPITVSIGVGAARDDVDASTLLSQADVAVYQAKREGRDRSCSYERDEPLASDAASVGALVRELPARPLRAVPQPDRAT